MRALAATLLALGVLAAPAAAPAAPPWQAAQRMQDLAFDAQSALLLDEPSSAVRLVQRARAQLRGKVAEERSRARSASSIASIVSRMDSPG